LPLGQLALRDLAGDLRFDPAGARLLVVYLRGTSGRTGRLSVGPLFFE
jgi:hypothetical protein